MSTLKIGWGRRCLSMDAPVSLPGQFHLRISERILDPLYATVLCVDGGEEAAFFCTCDVVVIRNNVIEPIRELVKSMRPELPTQYIIMGATHTHAGVGTEDTPETSPDGAPIYPGSKCREFFIRQCAEAICEAWDTRAEGGMSYGYGYATVAHSRRVVFHDDTSLRSKANVSAPNGHAVMYGNTSDDQFSHYEAGTDAFLNAMFTFNAQGKLTGIVVNVPCPSQLSEMFTEQTSDFWHEVRELVAKEYGEDVYVLPQCAAAGDLAPRILHYDAAQLRRMNLKYGVTYDIKNRAGKVKVMAERADIAERIMVAIRDVYSWASKDIQTDVTVHHAVETLQLPKRRITDEEKLWCEEGNKRLEAELAEKMKGDPETVRRAVSIHQMLVERNDEAIARWEIQDTDPNLPMECHVVRVGDIAFATNRFELYMDYMHRIQARSPFIQTFVVQLAGAEGGSYLATKRGMENKGYSASIFCNLVGHEGGQVLVDETLRMLNAVNQD